MVPNRLSIAHRTVVYLGVLTCALSLSSQVALAGSTLLGASGWQAEWDSSLDGLVSINLINFNSQTVYIQKEATFTQPPVNGIFPSIPILFRQVSFPAATSIVIEDERILNSTGVDWTDFHIDVLDGGDVVFDPVATQNSGGPGPIGFDIAPFTQAAFSNGDTRLDVWDGLIPNGTTWEPGSGVGSGELWFTVTPHETAPFTVFTLKETPTPEPATLSLFAIGLLAVLRRRR